ncbi:MAG: ATP-binding protein [Bacteroidales bacterium]|nr:ATP-binding protein [Clostridium sp.]MCM1203201.1 ATP-binding protein [Bacteroidales bacterium]
MEQKEEHIFPIEDALEMILMFNRTGKISYVNAAARQKLGYGDDLCGRHIGDVFPNDFQSVGDKLIIECSSGNTLQNFVAYRKNRTCFPVEVRIVRNDAESEIYICMASDILEKEFLNREIDRIKQEAQQAMKVKSEFVANVTHELRTPVNGVLGNVRELLERKTDKETEKSLHLIERCCDDMNKIINSILDFSKLEAGKFSLEPRKFHFRNMMDYVKANHINRITEKGLTFFMTVSPQIPEYIIGDELRIVQILNNLLSNAQKFTSLGKITVEVVKTAQVGERIELFFIVSDTGIGIDKGDRDKLFQSFSQVDASISRKYGGTGLGLNISKQLVELMGGNIEVESEKNKGSTFSFSIWVDACEGEETVTEPANEMQGGYGGFAFDGSAVDDSEELENIKKYGTPENRKNLKKNLSKLILCVEMENWEKAEMFMSTIKQLTEEAPKEVKRMVLRLKMAIQKENYEKTATEYKELNDFL